MRTGLEQSRNALERLARKWTRYRLKLIRSRPGSIQNEEMNFRWTSNWNEHSRTIMMHSVVRGGQIISRKPDDFPAFNNKMIELFA